jgi:hypothetical protein
MKLRKCEVKACGAVVMMVPLEQREIALDPAPIEVVVPGDEGGYRLVTGYRPHWATCVDIAGRMRHEGC